MSLPLPDWTPPDAVQLVEAVSRLEHQSPRRQPEPVEVCAVCGQTIDRSTDSVIDDREAGWVAHAECVDGLPREPEPSRFEMTPRDESLLHQRKRRHKARLLRGYYWPVYGWPDHLPEVA